MVRPGVMPPDEWLLGYVKDEVPWTVAAQEARQVGFTFTNESFREAYYRLGGIARPGARGSMNGASKLHEEAVQSIRNSPFTSLSTLADEYGVSRYTISRARNGHSWKHVTDDEDL